MDWALVLGMRCSMLAVCLAIGTAIPGKKVQKTSMQLQWPLQQLGKERTVASHVVRTAQSILRPRKAYYSSNELIRSNCKRYHASNSPSIYLPPNSHRTGCIALRLSSKGSIVTPCIKGSSERGPERGPDRNPFLVWQKVC